MIGLGKLMTLNLVINSKDVKTVQAKKEEFAEREYYNNRKTVNELEENDEGNK